jgi:antitoxin (DNA-binding transcriptional repressor) of toxin-antitoxin stability system
MKVVNIYEAKAKLSEYLDLVASGERVLICKRNQPLAELRAIPGTRTSLRPVGKAAGRLRVPPAFFEPLPDGVVDGFEGIEGAQRLVGQPARVAEPTGEYRVTSRRRRSK